MKKRIFGLLLLIAIILTLSQSLYAADEQDPRASISNRKSTASY